MFNERCFVREEQCLLRARDRESGRFSVAHARELVIIIGITRGPLYLYHGNRLPKSLCVCVGESNTHTRQTLLLLLLLLLPLLCV